MLLFNSYGFAAFLVATAIAFHATPVRHRGWVTLAASMAYYATFGWWPCGLLVASTAVAWTAAQRMRKLAAGAGDETERERRQLRVAALAVIVLLGVLALFKYAGALTQGAWAIAAPIGISYYTFKLTSYVLETHWGRIQTEHGFLGLLRYAAFFPQLLSGPIQRPEDYFKQEKTPVAAEVPLIVMGLRLMLFGFFKKLVVADRAGLLIDQIDARPFAHPPELHWLAIYVYAIELYADFSGFTDIAIGAGCLFGVKGPPNFDNPYYAPNIQEFWRRWHMSLSSWLGDYVFTPLRMALRNYGNVGLVLAITINMVAIGVWHGPSLTFVAFGVINAVYMTVSVLTLPKRNKWWKKRPRWAGVRRVVGAIVVFHLMAIAFIPFRSPTLEAAWWSFREAMRGAFIGPRLLASPGALFRTVDFNMLQVVLLVFGVVVMEAVHLARATPKGGAAFEARSRLVRWGLYYAVFVLITLFAMARSASFIYFQF